jgi:glycosyltransferase involved in cell wall biosynthesis
MFEAKFGRRGLLYRAVRMAERCTLALSRVVIATNESVLAAVKKRGRKKDADVFVVRTSPKLPKTEVPVDESLRKRRRFLVGYIGVMGNADGVEYLVRAAHHLVNTRGRTDIQFLLMGTGPEYDALVALRDELGLQDHMDFPGRVSNEFLFTALKTMDCGVACDPINAYNDHCTMNKTLEYMAFGKPQVMFGTREGRVSAAGAAVYVMENSAEQLGDAVAGLLDDPEKCRRLGEAGHYRLHHELNWERSVERLAAAYARALA